MNIIVYDEEPKRLTIEQWAQLQPAERVSDVMARAQAARIRLWHTERREDNVLARFLADGNHSA